MAPCPESLAIPSNEDVQMKHQADQGRRQFLRSALATGVAAGAAGASANAVAGLAPAVQPEPQTGYQLTDHVKAYYQSLLR